MHAPMLDAITPVILTYNEEPNIARTLDALAFAREIVVIDSYSTDRTVEIIRGYPNTRLLQRNFDSHAAQWTYAVHETGIATEWVLALDADYLVTEEACAEIAKLNPAAPVDGYSVSFRYCVFGRPLRGTLYPPVTALFRRSKGRYVQDGHTQRLALAGEVRPLSARFRHDDRKPLSHWLAAQDRYMRLETANITTKSPAALSLADRVRRHPWLAPFGVFFNCYILNGGILDGRAGLFYALQRMLAETLLGLRIIEAQEAAPTDRTLESRGPIK